MTTLSGLGMWSLVSCWTGPLALCRYGYDVDTCQLRCLELVRPPPCITYPIECEVYDWDGDNQIDLYDFAEAQNSWPLIERTDPVPCVDNVEPAAIQTDWMVWCSGLDSI